MIAELFTQLKEKVDILMNGFDTADITNAAVLARKGLRKHRKGYHRIRDKVYKNWPNKTYGKQP